MPFFSDREDLYSLERHSNFRICFKKDNDSENYLKVRLQVNLWVGIILIFLMELHHNKQAVTH